LIVFPAIDLKAGQVVRLAEGDMARATVYGDDPAAQAMLFSEAGSQYLHVVDLDGAFAGEAVNRAAVEGILKVFPGHVQLGGGIRNPIAVDGWFDLGVSRVVIGTAALKDPQFVKDMAKAYPGGIVVAVDARDGMVATEGWAEVSDVSIVDMARRFEDAGVASILFTDVGRDGLLKGCNIDATLDLAHRQSTLRQALSWNDRPTRAYQASRQTWLHHVSFYSMPLYPSNIRRLLRCMGR